MAGGGGLPLRRRSATGCAGGPRFAWLAIGLLPLLLGACELRPLYGKGPSSGHAGQELRSIDLGVIQGSTERTVYHLKNNLLDKLTPRGGPEQPRYRLDIDLNEFKEPLAITSVDEATRVNLVIAARYRLVDLAANRPVHAGEVRSTTAFNLLRADFGNVAAEQDARQRVGRELAESIRVELATWLARPESTRLRP